MCVIWTSRSCYTWIEYIALPLSGCLKRFMMGHLFSGLKALREIIGAVQELTWSPLIPVGTRNMCEKQLENTSSWIYRCGFECET